ncbi:hypothetical protein [Sorangium sp. So ce394]|uniref:hypothetical protein n=1 Tax=Sorangium sp. So ce394 TaxID=3133310 RepID=UPI003F5BC0AB
MQHYFDAEGMLHDAGRTCSREALRLLLESEGIPPLTPALDFEEAFGGTLSSPDETVLSLGTFQALLHQEETGRYSVDVHAQTLESDRGWPHVRWRGAPLIPVGHWHGIGDLYVDGAGVLHGYRWNDDALRAAAGSGRTFLESVALWWETFEKPIDCPPSFEARAHAQVAVGIARALSVPCAEEASDSVCTRYRRDDIFIEEIATSYAGGPLTTVWADKKSLLDAMRIARALAPESRIEASQDYGDDVRTLLQNAGLLSR